MPSHYITLENRIPITSLSDWRTIDPLWQLVEISPALQPCIFDMSNLTSLNPQAVIMLLMLCKKAKEKSCSNVIFDKLSPNVDGYLRRINFYDQDVAVSTGTPIEFNKNPHTRNLLELTKVSSMLQINQLGDWFYENFEHWFPDKSQSIYRQCSFEAINELCGNSVEHSSFEGSGEGYFVLQKYLDFAGKTNVIMSVGDYGIGIRNHMLRKYPDLESLDEAEILKQAISGKSGRLRNVGGRGLKSICNLTKEYGGYFVIRSGRGLLFMQNGSISKFTPFYPICGTQGVFCLKSPTKI